MFSRSPGRPAGRKCDTRRAQARMEPAGAGKDSLGFSHRSRGPTAEFGERARCVALSPTEGEHYSKVLCRLQPRARALQRQINPPLHCTTNEVSSLNCKLVIMAAKSCVSQCTPLRPSALFPAASSASRGLAQQRASMANLAGFKIPQINNEPNVCLAAGDRRLENTALISAARNYTRRVRKIDESSKMPSNPSARSRHCKCP